jgi:hypothetical protein
MQLVTPPSPFEAVVGMAASAKDRSWPFLPVAPTTAFWPCWHVQKADLERVLRVDSDPTFIEPATSPSGGKRALSYRFPV